MKKLKVWNKRLKLNKVCRIIELTFELVKDIKLVKVNWIVGRH